MGRPSEVQRATKQSSEKGADTHVKHRSRRCPRRQSPAPTSRQKVQRTADRGAKLRAGVGLRQQEAKSRVRMAKRWQLSRNT